MIEAVQDDWRAALEDDAQMSFDVTALLDLWTKPMTDMDDAVAAFRRLHRSG